LADLQCVARQLLDALADAPAVHGREREGFQHQQVECPLENVGRGGHRCSLVEWTRETIRRFCRMVKGMDIRSSATGPQGTLLGGVLRLRCKPYRIPDP